MILQIYGFTAIVLVATGVAASAMVWFWPKQRRKEWD